MTNCVLCSGIILCPRCEIKFLKSKIQKLEQQVAFLSESNSESLKIPHHYEEYIKRYVKQFKDISGNIFTEIQDLSRLHFVTITFDPNKFGNYNDSDLEKQYILYVLVKFYKSQEIDNFYGCFEHHKDGRIHTHVILEGYKGKIQETVKRMRKFFTDNPNNKICIDLGVYKKQKSINYITKESTHYYKSIPYEPPKIKDYNLDYDNNDLNYGMIQFT